MNNRNKDMYLPNWLFAFGVFLIAGAVFCVVMAYLTSYVTGFLVVCLGFFGLGVSAILCWRNQGITMLSDSVFVYSTMFGKKTEYLFSHITSLRQNQDSMTLFVDGDQKIHTGAERSAATPPTPMRRLSTEQPLPSTATTRVQTPPTTAPLPAAPPVFSRSIC
ncbi:MAG: hypothetical protein J6A79_04270 [Clostridia bacterium]|nr:hypothetical protein [Clostridia bacterium]